MGTGGYDRFAQPYNVNRVLDLQTLRLNQTAYDEYSPLYLPISFAMTYTLAWTIPPALLMQTLLIFGPVAYRALRGRPKPGDYVTDIHAKLMKRYPEVPLWWHGAAFIVGVGLAIGAALVRPVACTSPLKSQEVTQKEIFVTVPAQSSYPFTSRIPRHCASNSLDYPRLLYRLVDWNERGDKSSCPNHSRSSMARRAFNQHGRCKVSRASVRHSL